MTTSLDKGGGYERTFRMEGLRKLLVASRRVDTVLLTVLGALWVWKIVETAGRHAHLLRRNLGWGYVVDLSVPLGFTCALALFFLVRHIAGTRR